MYNETEDWVTCARADCDNMFPRHPINKKYCSISCKRSSAKEIDSYFSADSSFCTSTIDESIDEELAARNAFLRKENTRLNNLYEKYKNSADELFEQILKTVKSNIKQVEIKPPKENLKNRKAPKLVFNPWNADLQLGKVTPSYNTEVAYERIELYTDYIIQHYKDYEGSYDIPEIHVYFLGDIVEGEGIFPVQASQLDTSVFRQATVDGPIIYGNQLRRLLELGPKVKVSAVIGNHGRLSRYANPESNMDRVLYQTLYWMFNHDKRIEFDIPQGHGESSFYAVDKIGNYSTLLVHGDQFGPPKSQQSYKDKILGWKTGGIVEPFDAVALGHWHHSNKFTINQVEVRVSGSPESTNTYAQERLGVMARPSQHLQVIDPEHGVFWESDIFLD